MSDELSPWTEFSERKVQRAPDEPGILEIGRIPAWPETEVSTLYVASAESIRDRLLDELGNRRGDLSGAQYFRYRLSTSSQEDLQSRLEEYRNTTGIPEVNRKRSGNS